MLKMKWLLAFAAAALLSSCSSKQKMAVAPVPEYEFTQLDTMLVTAPRTMPSDTGKEEPSYELPVYRPSHARESDLLHTRLDLRFDWEKEQVLGKATLRLKPYFYPAETVTLDAKSFAFHQVSFAGSPEPLSYEYDGEKLTISLGRAYTRDEEYTLYIDYTAKPSETGGSAAITSDRGLFFINPRGEEVDKPRQIWTQGETENNSRWFPTIDKPNERCTQDMIVTVEDGLEALSNGALLSKKENGDGTTTFHWKMDQPHAPYLFMLAIGDYAVVQETWEDKPVYYYVEPEYKEDARAIFSHTREMLSFFSDKLGVKYPWPKFAQVVVHDYVSGAMENTTSVIFSDFVQQHRRELIDANNENIVAHELSHHWFGDLVTCESWANLTLNEGFANYSEYLWTEHQYGKDEADYHLLNEWSEYFGAARGNIHPLIYFGYDDKEDMFDRHSYNKGGAVLHMLRSYVGDEAFWAALNKYLTDNAYTAVEAHNLRLAFEAVTGQDLNWFFNQWYFSQGHPRLNITYGYDAALGQATVQVEQLQDPKSMPAVFELPVAIDIYLPDDEVIRKQVRVDQRIQTFAFDVPEKPRLVNFDAGRVLLAETTDNKSEEELLFQYYHAPKFLDRYEAVLMMEGASSLQARKLMEDALNDDFWAIRGIAVSNLDENAGEEAWGRLKRMAVEDPRSQVRVAAFEKLMNLENTGAVEQAKMAIQRDSAYNVIGAALQYLSINDREAALEYAEKLEEEQADDILLAVGEIYADSGDPSYLPFFEKNLEQVGGFSAIYFFEEYQNLAMQVGLPASSQAAGRLQPMALDETKSPWLRFSATRALNEIRKAYADSEDEAERQLSQSILEAIKKVKATEKNEQLKSYYEQMLPDVRP
ncbi:MAG: alanyl aminopeptidase [Lewinellaceae bacterium]|nr:alanyl aminopeptidase [Lewinellaceae bacterium]